MKNVIYMCYGRFGGNDCGVCEVADYCKAAKERDDDGVLRGEVHGDGTVEALDRLIERYSAVNDGANKHIRNTFSYEEVRSLLKFLSKMPKPVLEALHAIVDDCDLDRQRYISAIACQLGISRQSLSQSLQRAFAKYPELARVFLYRSKKR